MSAVGLGSQWTEDWRTSVGAEGFDKDGYQYAFNWQSGKNAKYDAKNGFSSCVRRRRLQVTLPLYSPITPLYLLDTPSTSMGHPS
eukprot:COSAG05_NODE_723_length_7727_cov_19.327871_6_plen_85_part_00